MLLVWWALVAPALAQVPADLAQSLGRLGEEAEIFARLSQKVIGEEVLEQVAITIPRFQPRGAPPPLKQQTRKIVSEYGFTMFKDDANLHEIRSVQTVDGRRVKPPGKLRETLSLGAQGDADRLKKNMLREFQNYGLKEAALEFGQIILMFLPRQLENFEFRQLRQEYLGADQVVVIGYAQMTGKAMMTVFEGRQVMKHVPRGELWLRARDGMPLRITMDTSRSEKGNSLRHFVSVDYHLTSYGCVMPVTASYAESVVIGDRPPLVFIENRFQYANFKMFGASSDVKFTVEDEPKPEIKK